MSPDRAWIGRLALDMSIVRALAGLALDALLPATCPGCGREGPPICAACARALDVRLDLPAGNPVGLPANLPAPLLQLEWCAPFTGVVRSALHALKYRGERRLAQPLGEALARRWARAGRGGDLLVPVPVHALRRRDRGYDQAHLIAEVAADRLGLPCAAVLERHRATAAQFDLDRRERATNVGGAFRMKGPVVSALSGTVAGRWVVLVDDVVTTGATLAACAETLLDAGADGVSAMTVARER